MKKKLATVLAGAAIAGTLGITGLSIGAGAAAAAPGPGAGVGWAEHPPGHGRWDDRWDGRWGGPRWGPPPPPPPAPIYYGRPGVCATGPLGYVTACI